MTIDVCRTLNPNSLTHCTWPGFNMCTVLKEWIQFVTVSQNFNLMCQKCWFKYADISSYQTYELSMFHCVYYFQLRYCLKRTLNGLQVMAGIIIFYIRTGVLQVCITIMHHHHQQQQQQQQHYTSLNYSSRESVACLTYLSRIKKLSPLRVVKGSVGSILNFTRSSLTA